MKLSTSNLTLHPEAAIDLQLHTTYSDGAWAPEQLVEHLATQQFGLAAVTDHDNTNGIGHLQSLAATKQMPLLAAVEMSCTRGGEMADFLCFGFDPEKQALQKLNQDLRQRQQANICEVYENLQRKGYSFDSEQDELAAVLEATTPQLLHALVALVKRHEYGSGDLSAGRIVLDAGGAFATHELAAVVEAVHHDGGVCLIAHPGRGDGFFTYDEARLDEIRNEVPIDGIEVYYPLHAPAQTDLFLAYAKRHGWLTSSGSDSHGPDHPPIKYPARLSQALLERVGIQIQG